MSDTARDYQQLDPVSTEGLAELFDTPAQPLRGQSETLAKGLSFKEACTFYGIKPTALRTRIKSGAVSAEKIDGANGPEWRIYPNTPVTPLRDPSATLSDLDHCFSETLAQPLRDGSDARLLDMVEALQAKLDKAHHELQAANYRVGYLENQVTERERDIQELDGTLKLLTDSQHKGGWWARFSSWFFGRG